jgi:uncharacterized protein YbjT (DUF2867 family)
MKNKILVLGATGNIGRPLVENLLARGEHVKAASRSGQDILGAEGVVFDYFKPECFEQAFEGVNRAYIMLAAGYVQSKELLIPLIEFAESRNVKVVLQTAFGVDADEAIPFRQVELALIQSGTPFVILRPNWFADNFHTFWKTGIDHGQLAIPAGDGKSSFIDVRDIAESAAAALTTEKFDGQAFNLTGPDAFSYAEAAQLLTEVIGKPISYNAIDDDTFIDMLTSAGVPVDYAAFLSSIFYPVREDWTSIVTEDVTTLKGKLPRSLKTYAQDHREQLANG